MNENDEHDFENTVVSVVENAEDNKVHCHEAVSLLNTFQPSKQHLSPYRQLMLACAFVSVCWLCVALVMPFLERLFHYLGLDSAAVVGLPSLCTILPCLAGLLWGSLSVITRRSLAVMVIVSLCVYE